jgi:hypothetical protein
MAPSHVRVYVKLLLFTQCIVLSLPILRPVHGQGERMSLFTKQAGRSPEEEADRDDAR